MIFSEGQGCCLDRTQNVSHVSVGHLKEQKVIVQLINHLLTNGTQLNTKHFFVLSSKLRIPMMHKLKKSEKAFSKIFVSLSV